MADSTPYETYGVWAQGTHASPALSPWVYVSEGRYGPGVILRIGESGKFTRLTPAEARVLASQLENFAGMVEKRNV